jgi:hypothetical protein
VSDWIAIRGPAFGGPTARALPAGCLCRGSLLLDIRLPQGLGGPIALADPANAAGSGVRITFDAARGLLLEERQGLGGRGLRHPGRVETKTQASLRMVYSWDAAEPERRLWLETAEDEGMGLAADAAPLPWRADDVAALFAAEAPARFDPVVQWLGLSRAPLGRNLGVAIGAASPVQVPGGAVRADELRLGDEVLTADHGARPVRWLRKFSLPCAGSLTPIRLRAPYFGVQADLIVAPNQRVRVAGAEVEYLFGEDEVLVQAHRLLGGSFAVPEARRPLADFVTLGFERPEVFFAGGCGLGSLPLGGGAPARRELHAYEAATLLASRDRVRNPLAA